MENILVVDDEEAIREVVSTMLESKGYRCTAVQNGRVAQDHVKKATPDLVLSDMIMPEMDGIRLLEWMRQYDPEVPVIMVTAIHDISTAPDPYWPILARAAFLHDIGKMAIPDSILRKPGPLDDAEKKKMREHCEIGYNMLIRIPFLRDAAEIVLAHQEFYDGSGYPRGLKGEQIPMGARIFTIADSLDAMISDRPYRRALPMSHAREEIKRCSGSQFDPTVVDVFMTIPEQHWLDLKENLGSPFRLAHLKNL